MQQELHLCLEVITSMSIGCPYVSNGQKGFWTIRSTTPEASEETPEHAAHHYCSEVPVEVCVLEREVSAPVDDTICK